MSITLHFHPDWPHGDGLVIESMAADGTYRNQFVTGISNGLLAPAADSPRRRWEDRLFGDRYATAAAGDRPVYGSWSRRADPYGGSPRFGSAHFRLRRAVADRATYCFPDSTFEPDAFGGPHRLEDLCRRCATRPSAWGARWRCTPATGCPRRRCPRATAVPSRWR
jgi:hypothetical protein